MGKRRSQGLIPGGSGQRRFVFQDARNRVFPLVGMTLEGGPRPSHPCACEDQSPGALKCQRGGSPGEELRENCPPGTRAPAGWARAPIPAIEAAIRIQKQLGQSWDLGGQEAQSSARRLRWSRLPPARRGRGARTSPCTPIRPEKMGVGKTPCLHLPSPRREGTGTQRHWKLRVLEPLPPTEPPEQVKHP